MWWLSKAKAAFKQLFWQSDMYLAEHHFDIDGYVYMTTTDLVDGEVRFIHECLLRGRVVRMTKSFYQHDSTSPMGAGDFVGYLKESKLVK